MQVRKISVIPTDRKIKKTKQAAVKAGILPKEVPLTREIHETTGPVTFNRIKDSILISIDNMRH